MVYDLCRSDDGKASIKQFFGVSPVPGLKVHLNTKLLINEPEYLDELIGLLGTV